MSLMKHVLLRREIKKLSENLTQRFAEVGTLQHDLDRIAGDLEQKRDEIVMMETELEEKQMMLYASAVSNAAGPEASPDVFIPRSLLDELSRAHINTRRAFHRLTPDRKRDLIEQFRHHLRACRKIGVDIDGDFVVEVVGNLYKDQKAHERATH